jgi:hypothetical protein
VADFSELKEEINKYQRALQAVAGPESAIPAGTALADVPALLAKHLANERTKNLAMREFVVQFLSAHEGVGPVWNERFFEVFHLEEFPRGNYKLKEKLEI